MRASYVESIKAHEGEIEVIEGPGLHHLLNVARVKQGQLLKLLDGKGKTALGAIKHISKKRLELEVTKIERFSDGEDGISVGFARPKKDSLEFCLRACVETGAKRIFVLESERAQNYKDNLQRYQKILETALEQSNNPFMPSLSVSSLNSLDIDSYDYCALASLRAKGKAQDRKGKGLLLVGPEGGFTDEEESSIFSHKNAFAVRFKGPILRTQTAIPFFIGILSQGSVEA